MYRKTIPITTPSASAGTVQYGETLGDVVKFEPYFASASGFNLGQCYYEAGTMAFCVAAGPSSAYFSVLAASYRSLSGYLTVYYTKATD